jgi:hypothetical protein
VEQPGARVRVTHPRTDAATRSARRGARRDLREQTVRGEVIIASLRRAQLRLALIVAAVFGAVLGGLPLLFAVFPEVRDAQVAGLPLGWLLLGLLVFPSIIAGGWWYVRAAERNERDFVDLVDRS